MSDVTNDRAEARPRVLLFFDYACSFCYVDTYRFDRLREEYDVDVVEVPFELRPDIAEAGISAKAGGLEHSEKVEAHLARLAQSEGIPYEPIDLIPNTHKAMILAEIARDAGLHEKVHRAVFRAYFGDGLDIGSEEVLLDLAAEAGLDVESVADTWASGRYEERLHAFYHLALQLGVDATPSALICNELMIGSRPYGVIRDVVERCLVTPDSLEDVSDGGDWEAVSSGA